MLRPFASSLAVSLVLASASQACTTSEDSSPGGADAGADTATSSDASQPDGSVQDGSTDATTADADATTDGGSDATTDGGSDAGACLYGGNLVAVTGSGTCALPYVVDLSGTALGSVASYVATGGTDQSTPLSGASCNVSFTATGRDVVFRVKMPNNVASLDVAAVPSASGDTRVAVAEDPSCGQPLNACSDTVGTGACDFVNAPKGGLGFFGTETFVVVSEVTSSGQPITVYFRAN